MFRWVSQSVSQSVAQSVSQPCGTCGLTYIFTGRQYLWQPRDLYLLFIQDTGKLIFQLFGEPKYSQLLPQTENGPLRVPHLAKKKLEVLGGICSVTRFLVWAIDATFACKWKKCPTPKRRRRRKEKAENFYLTCKYLRVQGYTERVSEGFKLCLIKLIFENFSNSELKVDIVLFWGFCLIWFILVPEIQDLWELSIFESG